MKKFIFIIILSVVILTFSDYYNSYIGNITKEEAILIIDTRFTTLFMILLIFFLYRKKLHYKDTEWVQEQL